MRSQDKFMLEKFRTFRETGVTNNELIAAILAGYSELFGLIGKSLRLIHESLTQIAENTKPR